MQVMADLENGLWAGNEKVGANDTSLTFPYVTAMVKGGSNGPNHPNGLFALKGGDATNGKLTTMYEGPRPGHYSPMKKQGSIILGIGGDNSCWAQGTFYEGVAAPVRTVGPTASQRAGSRGELAQLEIRRATHMHFHRATYQALCAFCLW